MAYGIGKPQIIHHKIATSKNVGSKNVTENCLYLKTGLNIEGIREGAIMVSVHSLTQDSRNALNRSRTGKKPIF